MVDLVFGTLRDFRFARLLPHYNIILLCYKMARIELIKEQITKLEKQVQNMLAEQNLLKNQNQAIYQQIQSFTKKSNKLKHQHKNIEQTTNIQCKGELQLLNRKYQEQIAKIQMKYSKNKQITNSKIKNCQQTLQKYKVLYQSLTRQNAKVIPTDQSLISIQNISDLEDTSMISSTNSGITHQVVISQLKCPQCQQLFKPYRYFQHTQNCQGSKLGFNSFHFSNSLNSDQIQ